MEQKKELKRNKAIQITAIIMLIIAAIAIVLMLPVNTITANAAAENLLKESYTATPVTLMEIPVGVVTLGHSLNLQEGNEYTIRYKHNGVEYTVTAIAHENAGMIMLGSFDGGSGYAVIDLIPGDENSGVLAVYDNAEQSVEQLAQPKDNSAVIMFIYFNGNQSSEIPDEIISIETEIERKPLKSTDIISNVTGGFTNFLTGTGEGIANFFEVIFTDSEGNISIMAIVFLSLMGLGLASGVIRILLNRF